MGTARKPPVESPRYVRHARRPEWGPGRVLDVYAGLVRVRFGDGVTREFRDDVFEPVAEADVPDELRTLPATPAPTRPASRTRPRRTRGA